MRKRKRTVCVRTTKTHRFTFVVLNSCVDAVDLAFIRPTYVRRDCEKTSAPPLPPPQHVVSAEKPGLLTRLPTPTPKHPSKTTNSCDTRRSSPRQPSRRTVHGSHRTPLCICRRPRVCIYNKNTEETELTTTTGHVCLLFTCTRGEVSRTKAKKAIRDDTRKF